MSVSLDANAAAHSSDKTDRCLTIGLVNNMPDEALKATERQWVSLLQAACHGMPVRLSFYTLPGIPRTAAVQEHIREHYSDIDHLWNGKLDGLIVTGREPLAARLEEEPYWPGFKRLLAWARQNAHSTIWSCLAAHAAVLHMDGIERVRRSDKLFGVFDCTHASGHPLLAAMPATVRLPHSRWNGVAEDRLLACGYEVLTRGAEVGVDTFIKQDEKLFVFFQGHPEYAADTLLREYRRDIARYDRGDTECYPSLPSNYFSASTGSALAAMRVKAMTYRKRNLQSAVAAALNHTVIQHTWDVGAATICRNWLTYLCAQKVNLVAGPASVSHSIFLPEGALTVPYASRSLA